MDRDPLSRDAALERVKEAGRKAGLWGSPKDANPYLRAASMVDERSAWEAGRQIGAAARKAGKA